LLLVVCFAGCSQGDVDTQDDDTYGDDDTVADDDTQGDDDTHGDDDTQGDDDTSTGLSSLSAQPTELNFNTVPVNGLYTSSFMLNVTGDADVNVFVTTLSGENVDSFTAEDLSETVIPAWGSVQLNVEYAPTEPATHYAEVVIYSDAEPAMLAVLMYGTAQADLDDVDNDGDGATENEGDCDDADDQMYPGAPELCNGLDDDCDGAVPADESIDADGDGAIECEDCDDQDAELNLLDADFDAWSTCAGDCDDTTSTVRPGAPEACNGVDDDCDGSISPSEIIDADNDYFLACEDCDDYDPQVNPNATDIPNDGVDSNCDGVD